MLYLEQLKRIRRAPKGETPKRALSSSWFKAATPVQRETLSRKIENFAKNGPATIDKFAWTVFAADREKIERSRFAREECWIPVNARATNNFKHKTHMAYCVDIYLHPNTSNYLKSRGVFISADLYALSEMIQWIWRGCIRCLDGQDMTVYVPSERMRKLLRLWVSCDSIGELYEKLGVPLR